MPTTIVIKHSNTEGDDPDTTDIIEGELALNTKDGTLWTRDDEDNMVQLIGSGGATHTHNANTDITNWEGSHNHTASEITDLSTYILAASRPSVSVVSATTYTLDADDEYSVVRFTNTNAVTVTVPPNSDEEIPVGFTVHLHYEGEDALTVAEGTGVTVNSSKSLLTAAQYSALSLLKVATDQWLLVGDQG